MKLDRWIIAIGDPFNGIALVGLWTSGNEAVGYAERHYSHEQWELVRLKRGDGKKTRLPLKFSTFNRSKTLDDKEEM